MLRYIICTSANINLSKAKFLWGSTAVCICGELWQIRTNGGKEFEVAVCWPAQQQISERVRAEICYIVESHISLRDFTSWHLSSCQLWHVQPLANIAFFLQGISNMKPRQKEISRQARKQQMTFAGVARNSSTSSNSRHPPQIARKLVIKLS